MNKKVLIITIISALLLLAVVSSFKKRSDGDMVIATISNKTLTAGEFKSNIARLPAYYQNIIKKDTKRYLDETILSMLLYEEAIRRGLDRDREVKEVLSEAKKKIVTAKFVKNEVDDKVVVTEAEMRQLYESKKSEFKTDAMWRVSHILVATEKEARDILSELSGGADFAQIAKAHSIDATATRGGDVGFFRNGQLIPDFEKEALKLNIGEMSDVVHTQFGYHIIKMTDKKESAVKSFEEARRDIEAELIRRKRAELFDKLVSNLKSKYSVKIDEAAFEAMEGVKKAPAAK